MQRWRDKWALVTGPSAGIGREIARQLAAAGAHLVLAARRRERLDELAAEVRSRCGIRVEVLVADLAQPETPQTVFDFTRQKGMEVELLVNNAGFGMHGEFHRRPYARFAEMVQVNVTAVMHLTHLFLPQMIERRRGDILVVSSTAGFQAVPYIATYAATKAFELVWAEALAEEMKGYGVRVCTLCPGSTTTEFQEIAGSPPNALRVPETAEKVARVGLRAMAAGKRVAISGRRNWVGVQAQRVLPRATVAKLAARLFEKEQE
jgi:short-subunit dehydrogenase